MVSAPPLRVLYISYDGLLDPLGQSQILPYLDRLSARNVRLYLLTFEKEGKRERQALRPRLSAKGISWISARYHKAPTLPAASLDILVGIVIAMVLVLRHRIHVVHARSYVAAFLAWILKRGLGVRFIFDMRGFWADERVEGGLWPRGCLLYRVVKRLEAKFLADADHVVTLTPQAMNELIDRRMTPAPITVIPTCTNLNLFRPNSPSESATAARPLVFIYSGSIGTWYLLGEMLEFFRRAGQRFPGSQLRLLTHGDETLIRRELARRSISPELVRWEKVNYCEVPRRLADARVGLAFYRPGYSRQATCPTKIGEYLACGLPVVINSGVGNTQEIVEKQGVGVVIPDFTGKTYDEALIALELLLKDPELPNRCRRIAAEYFSLDTGVERYWQIYQQVGSSRT